MWIDPKQSRSMHFLQTKQTRKDYTGGCCMEVDDTVFVGLGEEIDQVKSESNNQFN
jgi:hypothetical protein